MAPSLVPLTVGGQRVDVPVALLQALGAQLEWSEGSYRFVDAVQPIEQFTGLKFKTFFMNSEPAKNRSGLSLQVLWMGLLLTLEAVHSETGQGGDGAEGDGDRAEGRSCSGQGRREKGSREN